ncbi:MAG: prepilin-type cleavage/methylation domain-containing protein [Candidatus Dactylopiibacterium carminicum]|uniref:Prepilin-type cleavage/methylation domain-containing protein n=1 Tax=Candidatus Dactylopiibacterium carminicum TaxID=857335 RepID=A0A272ERF8_9RHOO|nr:type II secretion system protein [Candidatus Dactylopiibacterium carminicum]KAF7598782.1 type II secretion system protein [Candidatus Dactylopiibacterium carminicum]PAS92691.1 MAG: prepilin-type cleavage/methylation domain-containing protein [Candidatus Dactylopiibacterium carminicum]PAS94734.1 MAG: prepilin-type cleavage/methylation domain-containing protein [Candidatus Dactylopiibacterium carminicum]PAS98803.1 MAG: hypothetical protein BSR46_11325 [Candidatus Dactylopiibacterium carminicum
MNRARTGMQGFTLMEIAIVMVVIGLLAGGSLAALRAHQLRAQHAATRDALEEARQALFHHAVLHGRVPCPAKSPIDGEAEAPGNNGCPRNRGLLPWATLGVQGLDGWHNRLSYIASSELTRQEGISLSVQPGNGITLNTRDPAGNQQTLATAKAVAFALWSHGSNGHGAVSAAGTLIADASDSNHDEDTNTWQGSGNTVYARDPTDNSAVSGGEFDDIVVWGSYYVLIGRLLAAGQLSQASP